MMSAVEIIRTYICNREPSGLVITLMEPARLIALEKGCLYTLGLTKALSIVLKGSVITYVEKGLS